MEELKYVDLKTDKNIKIPTFNSLLNIYKDDFLKSEKFEWYKREMCYKEQESCIQTCNNNVLNNCENECEIVLENCFSNSPTYFYNGYSKKINSMYDRQTENLNNVLNNDNLIYRQLEIDYPEIFIEELKTYGKTTYQCGKKKMRNKKLW